MAEAPVQRRLAAILAADIAGFSRLIEADEAATVAALKARERDVIVPAVARHNGRIMKFLGDGVLAEFGSAVNAVDCAIELQKGMNAANDGVPDERRLVLRIGVNLGDVVVEGDDLYGDGVNISARLEAQAEPGGVLVSETVFRHVRGKVSCGFDDLGEQKLKNMADPVRVYRIAGVAGASRKAPERAKVSVAVLPFLNMSGDQEQEYFSDGLTEDVIADLSKVSGLSVVSRNTAFTFKGKATDMGEIARRLKVGHVVEGSVRKAGGRVRVTAQLIDAANDNHLWAERYDRDISDIFAMQDELTQAIVGALKVKLLPEEKKAIESRSTQDPEAYRLYLLARYHLIQTGAKNLETGLHFAQRAVAIDAGYARAWAVMALLQCMLHMRGLSGETGLEAAERAIAADATLGEAHAAKARALSELGRHDEARIAQTESLRLDPDSDFVQGCAGWNCVQTGRYAEAAIHLERAAELDQSDFANLSTASVMHKLLGNPERSMALARQTLDRIEREIALHPDNTRPLIFGVGVLAHLGEKLRAKEWLERALLLGPDDPVGFYNIACAMVEMGEHERALDALERCLPMMSPESIGWTKADPELFPLHGNPRFEALVASAEARLAAGQEMR